jgi:magnesium chelatase subunit D
MPDPESRQINEFIDTLCAMMLVPGLRSILIFDANRAELRKIVNTTVNIAQIFTGQTVDTVTLGSSETDDDLWGTLVLQGRHEAPLCWQPGLLSESQNQNSTRIAFIPDLAQLSLMAARACIAMVGQSVASSERHGQHSLWQPDDFWIAGCASADVGKVSAHLLDRFAIRLNRKKVPNRVQRTVEIKQMLGSDGNEDRESYPLPPDLSDRLKFAANFRPMMTEDAMARLIRYIPTSGFYSTRRDLSLARLAVAIAHLDNQHSVIDVHINRAAKMIGLSMPADAGVKQPWRDEEKPAEEQTPTEVASISENLLDSEVPSPFEEPTSEPQLVKEFAREVDTPAEVFPSVPLPSVSVRSPYPEDEAPIEHEDTPLRLPLRAARSDVENGPIVGTERATSLHDLALVRTVMESTKFKRVRQKQSKLTKDRLLILACDLHSYRREPIAEQIFVLLLDYTSLRNEAWTDALYPYLKEAYTERAIICLIKVGAADARHELRAEMIEARSLLVPEIGNAFNALPGRGTPLAHGLDLAFQALRRHLQHGRGGPYRATLVVLSDGRGNIPLEDSRRGEIAASVMRRGFEDSLVVGRQISHLDYVRVVYLNPQPEQLTELPVELANALGAEMREIETTASQTV